MEHIDKIVNFEHCKFCEYYNKPENEEPCNECLNNPVNTYSRKPINFKEKEDK